MSVRHVTVEVPATTANLGPGFDALGAAVSRYLTVQSRDRSASPERVTTTGEGEGEVATGEDNLIWRCLVRFCDEHAQDVPDVALRVHNDVPLERGMGSSSAAIVAGLALGRALTGAAVGDLDLVDLANDIEGHPDNVAPAILGGFVACATADDGALVVRRTTPAPTLRPLLMVPQTRQLTTTARGVLPDSLTRAQVASHAARTGHVVGAFVGAWPMDPRLAGDLLHEEARFGVMAPTGALVRDLRAAGVHAWLSGAGPAVAAVIGPRDRDALDASTRTAAAHGFEAWALDWDLSGVLVCPAGGCAFAGTGTCGRCPSRRV